MSRRHLRCEYVPGRTDLGDGAQEVSGGLGSALGDKPRPMLPTGPAQPSSHIISLLASLQVRGGPQGLGPALASCLL